MKTLLCVGWVSLTIAAAQGAIHPVSMAEINARVSQENYYVLENAQRVYQAKQSVQLARRNLLPKLNLWRIITTPFNPRSLIGIVEDIAPFLIPNNWLRVAEERLFAEASRQGHRALWGNELLTARGLFWQASLEENLLSAMTQNTQDLERILEIVRAREALGALPAGSSRQIEVQLLAGRDDTQTLRRVVAENRSQLAFILGFSGNDEAVPTGVTYVSRAAIPLKYEDYESAVIATAPELKQFQALIVAADYVRRERYFNFLGSSSMSRGVGGGVFDDLPQQDGLGFGLGPSIRIVRAQKRILQIQKDAVEETLRKNLKLLVGSYNLDLTSRLDAISRLDLTEEMMRSLEDRMRLGDHVDVIELVQAAAARMEALGAYHAIEVRILLNLDRLERLKFSGAFNAPPSRFL